MCQELMNGVLQSATDGLGVMLVGMGVVFTFLTILVFSINIMAKVIAHINTIWPEPVEEVKTAKKAKKSTDDAEIALAVAMASAQG